MAWESLECQSMFHSLLKDVFASLTGFTIPQIRLPICYNRQLYSRDLLIKNMTLDFLTGVSEVAFLSTSTGLFPLESVERLRGSIVADVFYPSAHLILEINVSAAVRGAKVVSYRRSDYIVIEFNPLLVFRDCRKRFREVMDAGDLVDRDKEITSFIYTLISGTRTTDAYRFIGGLRGHLRLLSLAYKTVLCHRDISCSRFFDPYFKCQRVGGFVYLSDCFSCPHILFFDVANECLYCNGDSC